MLQVACTDAEFPLNELKVQPHQGMLESIAGSVFCLMMPGNSQSSQRLTEAFLAGCIPVFLGPPWHTLPFSTEVGHAPAAFCWGAQWFCSECIETIHPASLYGRHCLVR